MKFILDGYEDGSDAEHKIDFFDDGDNVFVYLTDKFSCDLEELKWLIKHIEFELGEEV